MRTAASLLGLLIAGSVGASELCDAELVPSGLAVLQNDTGTVRMEDARVGRLGAIVLVPEPAALWQCLFAVGLLALLAGRRRNTTSAASEQGSSR